MLTDVVWICLMKRYGYYKGAKSKQGKILHSKCPVTFERNIAYSACIIEASVTVDTTAELLEKVLSSTAANAHKQEADLKQPTAKLLTLSSNSRAASAAERNAYPEPKHWQSNLTNTDKPRP